MALSLVREETCVRALAWRFDLPADIPWLELFERLRQAGLREGARLGTLVRFSTPEQHEVVFVTSTGRAQIRVHYTTAVEERRHAAESVMVTVARVLGGRVAMGSSTSR